MKSLVVLSACVAFLASCAPSDDADRLTINVEADGQSLASVSLTVDASLAIAAVEGKRELFNIRDMSWFEPSTGEWVSLTRCKDWADQSKTKSLASAAAASADIRAFLLWSLDPSFEVQESNGTLRLTSGQIDYVLEGVASKNNATRFFNYAVLNAYKKAMTEQKMLPFAELKALAEMNKRGYIPHKITVVIPGVLGAPGFVMKISED